MGYVLVTSGKSLRLTLHTGRPLCWTRTAVDGQDVAPGLGLASSRSCGIRWQVERWGSFSNVG